MARTVGKETRIRTLQFGVLRVLRGAEVLLRALADQQELWNDLVMLEGKFRKDFVEWSRELNPELRAIDARIAELKKAYRLAADDDRVALVDPFREATALARSLRGKLIQENATEIRAIRANERQLLLDASRQSGLWWSHRESVLERFEISRWTAVEAGKFLWPRPFTGDGTLVAKLTSGGMRMSANDLFARRSAIASIREPTVAELGSLKLTKGDGGRRVVLRVCAARREDNDQADAELLVTMHRDISEHDRVRQIHVTRKSLADSLVHGSWTLGMVVESPESPARYVAGNAASVRLEAAVGDSQVRRLRFASVRLGHQTNAAELGPRWFELVEKSTQLRLDKDARVAQILAELREVVNEPRDNDSRISRFANAARTFFEGQPGLRALERLFESEDAALARDARPDIEALARRVEDVVVMSERADLLMKKACRHRTAVFRQVAASAANAASSMIVEVPSTINELNAVARNHLPDGVSIGWPMFVAAVEDACKSRGVPIVKALRPTSS